MSQRHRKRGPRVHRALRDHFLVIEVRVVLRVVLRIGPKVFRHHVCEILPIEVSDRQLP